MLGGIRRWERDLFADLEVERPDDLAKPAQTYRGIVRGFVPLDLLLVNTEPLGEIALRHAAGDPRLDERDRQSYPSPELLWQTKAEAMAKLKKAMLNFEAGRMPTPGKRAVATFLDNRRSVRCG